MKRFFYQYNLLKFNILSQIIITLFFLSFEAEASSLKISTNQVCNFLKEQGLKAQLSWKKNDLYENQWGCANKLSISEIDAPLNFTYQATGDEQEVKNIEIKAEVKDHNYSRLMQKKLLEISEIISKKLLGIPINQQIKDAINNGKSLSYKIENSIIKISQEKISANNGYIISFKIYSEN
jgi:hypothetical protein